jgi:NAD(P)-dependent dehydrogenase (short-subunit alcohol dehydrogenase family)
VNDFNKQRALVTGGTDGIGAATAMALAARGAEVTVIGRSAAKAEALMARAAKGGVSGSLRTISVDLSSMCTVLVTADRLAQQVPRFDVVLHAVGVLIPRKSYTDEGLERCFATSYLSRFLLTQRLCMSGTIDRHTRLINVAASAPKIPRFAKLDFPDLATVEDRTGMKGHGQSQLANDLFTVELARRYGLTTVGYGPGSVDTQIRRELPRLLVVVMQPLFRTRLPEEAARELLTLFLDPSLRSGQAAFFTKGAMFAPDPFITHQPRAHALWFVSEALVDKALNSSASAMAG